MPLYKTITVNEHTKAYIWKVAEPYEWLSKDITLTAHCQQRIDGMKSHQHKKGFMSIRHLMAEAGYTDQDLYYDELGKPHLTDDNYISITHSFEFTGIIISTQKVGIDIERQREKILKIAHKFTPLEEYHTLANEDALIRKLTIVWGGKEAIYKLYAQPGLGFLQHINISDFDFDNFKTTGKVEFKNQVSWYDLDFLEFEKYTCVYALESKQGKIN